MKFLFVFAHPDDETFSSGGTIAQLTQAGNAVVLICATRGEEGELGDPPVCSREELGIVREEELRNAAKILGISNIHFFEYKDATLSKISQTELQSKLLPLYLKEKPDIVITFDKNGGSNHPDHIAISRAATEVFGVYMQKVTKKIRLYHTATPTSYLKKYEGTDLEYKSFGKIIGVKDEDITTIIDISKTYKVKQKAAECHKTQQKDWKRFLKRAEIADLKKEFFTLILENKF